jgi:hypothetical protein
MRLIGLENLPEFTALKQGHILLIKPISNSADQAAGL